MTQDVYILRIFHEDQRWRATVTDTRTHQKYNFATVDKLLDFFKDQLESDTLLPQGSSKPGLQC
jgi:hypothetical protein